MKRIFRAYGVLYTAGDTVGLTDKTITEEAMKKIVVNSPLKIPVVNDLGKVYSDPECTIGMGTILYQPGTDVLPARLTAMVEFNGLHRKEYETLLNNGKERKKLRFGFMIGKVNHAGTNITDGVINAISLNDNGLGGEVISYGWDTEDEGRGG